MEELVEEDVELVETNGERVTGNRWGDRCHGDPLTIEGCASDEHALLVITSLVLIDGNDSGAGFLLVEVPVGTEVRDRYLSVMCVVHSL